MIKEVGKKWLEVRQAVAFGYAFMRHDEEYPDLNRDKEKNSRITAQVRKEVLDFMQKVEDCPVAFSEQQAIALLYAYALHEWERWLSCPSFPFPGETTGGALTVLYTDTLKRITDIYDDLPLPLTAYESIKVLYKQRHENQSSFALRVKDAAQRAWYRLGRKNEREYRNATCDIILSIYDQLNDQCFQEEAYGYVIADALSACIEKEKEDGIEL